MASRNISVDITANDRASSVFNNVRHSVSNMSSSIMTALGGSIGAVNNLDNALRTYNSSMYRFNRAAIYVFRQVGDSIKDFTKDAINNFTELEQQHAKTMGAMATEYGNTIEAQQKFLEDSKKLKQQAMELGTWGPNNNGSLYSVTDVSSAQTALVKAGMSADDLTNSNVVESILKFAGGNDLDVDTATTFAVNLGTVFDKPVEEWGKMLDMVTKAADISVIDVEDIMDSLTYTGGIASGLGRDLEEVLGVISVMGQAGLRGRVAGTGLQAFFTRILSAGELTDTQIGKAPSEYVGNIYNAFIKETTNADGSFKDMDEVAESLDTVMESLNDQEQAWFAKKLFGLYQMKAAYALTGAVDGDENLITDFIDQIENQSEGTNSAKYDLMLNSQYGKLELLQNAWEGIKTDFGERLSPIVSTISSELFSFFKDPENYKINFDNLRTSIEESGELIAEGYGTAISDAVTGLLDFGVNAAQIAEALTPEAGGIITGIGKLLNGDISGALEEFNSGIEDTNDNIDDLPPELQDMANTVKRVVAALTILAGINLGTQILQIITSAFNTFIAKPINAVKSLITATTSNTTATSATVSSTSTVVNTTYTDVNAGTATSVNIGSVPLMNVTATVVNVYGGGGIGNNPSNGTPTLPGGSSGGTPILPGGSGPLLLPGGSSGTGGSGTPVLPGGSGGSGGSFGGSGEVITLYKFFGKYMTIGQIFKTIATKAGIILGLITMADAFTSPGLVLDGSKSKKTEQASGNIDAFVGGKLDGGLERAKHDAYINDYWVKAQPGYKKNADGTDNSDALIEAEYNGRKAARDEMMAYYKSDAGIKELYNAFSHEIANNGKLTEDFLTGIMTWTKDGYTYTGWNEDIKEILKFMYSNFDTDYKDSRNYTNRFNETAISEFVNGNNSLNPTTSTIPRNTIGGIGGLDTYINSPTSKLGTFFDSLGTFMDKLKVFSPNNITTGKQNTNSGTKTELSSIINTNLVPFIRDTNSASSNVLNSVNSASSNVLNSTSSVISSVNSAMSRVQQPILNVYVTTNVDKSGNTKSIITIDEITKMILNNASRYGSSKN